MKALSKSRFKLGLECPNKVFFSNSPDSYNNLKKKDTFLEALASGGFQVEEYARLQYPNGVLIEEPAVGPYDYQDLADQTTVLLKRENVVIYEAAFYIDNLFIRTDILVKTGTAIKLIEVKAKSYNPEDAYTFLGQRGGLVKGWKPYLFDLAFQTYVVQLALPDYTITPNLCLVNKTKKATEEGLNQLFRVKKQIDKRTGITVLATDKSQLGENLLGIINMSDIVSKIHDNQYRYHDNLGFEDAIQLLSEVRQKDYYPNWPAKFAACKACEFKNDDVQKEATEKQSGFEVCFKKQFKWTAIDFKKSNIFNIWDFKDAKIMEQGILFKDQLSPEIIKYKEVVGRLSRTERQWIQIEKERDNDFTDYVDVKGLRAEMNSWTFPLHFIDFETSTVPLPFHSGRKPYEQIAFQFSHHIYHKDGRIEHANEYINTTPGEFPNFEFIQHLHRALMHDKGTIFRFATHENTILNAIHSQLKESNYRLKDQLIQFIESISNPKNKHPDPWKVPERNMVDLCEIIKKYYFNPYTFGSNSIKKVLPAILMSSKFIKQKYSQSIGKIGVSSKNFMEDHIWLKEERSAIISPYKMLPKVFDNLEAVEIERYISGIENINDGGAALTAYGKIQYVDMPNHERELIKESLLKYCELDTLAMVMIYEHLKSIS